MEIQINWRTQDCYIDTVNKPIIASLNASNTILSSLNHNSDYIITSLNANTNIAKTSLLKDILPINSNIINIAVSPSNETIKQIRILLSMDQSKEIQYSELKKQLESLKAHCSIKSLSLQKKFWSLIRKKSTYYYKLIDCIVEKLLHFEKAKREIKEVQSNMIKYKSSQIINLYFKMSYERNCDMIEYLMSNCDFFLGNKENNRNSIEAYQVIIRLLAKDANADLREMLKDKQIYKDHIEEYEELLIFIEQALELYPVLKHSDMKCPRIVFSALDPPVHLKQSECDFLIIKNIQTQLPTYDALKIVFNNFKEGEMNKEAIEMAYKRDCYLYTRFGSRSLSYIYASLLYEEQQ